MSTNGHPAPRTSLCKLNLLPFKQPQQTSNANRHSAPSSSLTVKDLLCNERLDAKSPELWPEQVRGVTRFISSLVPLGSGPVVECNQSEWTSDITSEEINMIYSMANLSESALMDKIKDYNNLSFQLGLEEAHEMTRGNLLHIFDQKSHF